MKNAPQIPAYALSSARKRTAGWLLSTALLTAAPAVALAQADPATTTAPITTPAPTPSPARVQGPPDGMIAPPPVSSAPINAGPRGNPFPEPVIEGAAPAPVLPPVIQQAPRNRPQPAPQPQLQRGPLPLPQQALPPQGQPGGLQQPAANGAFTGISPVGAADPSLYPPVDATPDANSVPVPATPAETPAPASSLTDRLRANWQLLAGAAGLLALVLFGWLWNNRRQRLLALPAPDEWEAPVAPAVPAPQPLAPATSAASAEPGSDAQPQAAAAPPPPAAAPIATAPAVPRPIIGRRADLALDFAILSAQTTFVNFRMRYAITLRNNGTVDAAPVAMRIGMFAGTNANEFGIMQWMMRDDEAAHHGVDGIAAGQEYRFEGELAAPLEALNAIVVEGRTIAIPIIAIDTRYHHGTGEAPLDGQVARAFVVGREMPAASERLAPFRLDQGPTAFAPLGQRDTGIGKTE